MKLAAAHHAADRARALAGRTSKATPSFLRYLLARFQSDGCTTAAAALGYTSLLAIVPMLTIALSMFAAFPFFSEMRVRMVESLFSNLAPSLGVQVQTYLSTFMDNAGKATGAGIVGLAVTAILLIHTIQTAFDRIFGSDSRKTQWNRFPIYWALLTLGPILFGVSLSISTYFFQVAGETDLYGISTGVQILGNILPFVLEAAGFALFYRLMPTRPVLNVDAIWGGVTAAFLFEVVKRAFGLYLTYAPTYQALYGALAAIPIFMVWMYLAWVITLIGAEITASLPEWRAGRRSFVAHHKRGDQLSLSLGALALLRHARAHGVGVRTQDFVKELHADPVQMYGLLEQLRRGNIIAHSDRGRWVLTRDLTGMSMHYLSRVLGVSLAGGESGSVPRVGPLIDRLDKDEQGMLSQSVEDALASLDKPAGETEAGETAPAATKEAANSR